MEAARAPHSVRGDFQITMEDLHSLSQSLVASTTIGSTRVVRRAGTKLAMNPVTATTVTTPANVSGSPGLMSVSSAHEDTRGREAGGQADRHPGGEPAHAHSERQTQNVATAGAHGQTDADLAGLPRDGVSDQTVDAQHHQREPEARKRAEHEDAKSRSGIREAPDEPHQLVGVRNRDGGDRRPRSRA